jgi:hypothetical protein
MSDTSLPASPRWTVRDLPLAARLTLAAFLVSVGIGYFSALVQLHFQHAKQGSLLPDANSVIEVFHGHVGELPKSRIVRLVEAPDTERFTGTGQMSAAFFKRSKGFAADIKRKAKALSAKRQGKATEADLAKAEAEVRQERQGERQAVLSWLGAGADKDAYDEDKFFLPQEVMVGLKITPKYADKDDKGTFVKIKTLFTERCTRCHAKDGDDAKAADFPLEKWEQIDRYNKVEVASAMSMTKLAQTTHVHLLGFATLYGLTGLIFALTRYPGFLRVLVAPLPLLAQVIDIAFWWLARLDAPHGPMFATWIPISGAVVGVGLGLHIVLSLFDLFRRVWARILLVLLLFGALASGAVVKERVIDPYMAKERAGVETTAAKK